MSSIWYNPCDLLLDASRVKISNVFPSVWTEANVIMGKPIPGPFRYSKTPYTREIVDRAHVSDPVKEIAVMGSAQWGKTGGVVNPFLVWMIRNCPGPAIMTIGNESLIDNAVNKLDEVIYTSGTKPLIKSQTVRNKSQKTGDTNRKKDFPGGFIRVTPASNPKEIRQDSLQYGVFDDFDAMRGTSKSDGDQRLLLLQRFKTYHTNKKIFWISTPTIKGQSNIEKVYLMGDQRKFFIPCPCCGSFITLDWQTEKDDGTKYGITWDIDDKGRVIKESVGYICQDCGGFWNDKEKGEIVNQGYWKATAEPQREDITSYYMNALYSPAGMTDWLGIINEYLECFDGTERIESKWQTFLNLVLGLPYEPMKEKLEAKNIQGNQYNYEIGLIPEKLSIEHGNGSIVLLTCGADLNGTIDDARLDYSIIGWSETGSQYNISHGSIGTYNKSDIQKKYQSDRIKWTYDWEKENNVWDELYRILSQPYLTDTDRGMHIFGTGIDEGYMTHHVRRFVENCNLPNVFSVKGSSADNKYSPHIDKSLFKKALEVKTGKLYILNIGKIKDSIAEQMRLKFDAKIHDSQPRGFMNFPWSANGLYQYNNFFSHFEAEERKVVDSKDGVGISFRWEKKSAAHQNHLFDCAVYNYGVKEIVSELVCKEAELKNHTWADFAQIITNL